MKKKFSVIFIFIAFAFTLSFAYFNSAKFIKSEGVNLFEAKELEQNETIKSKSAYLIDAYSGEVLLEKNAIDRLPIASMCKIMTLLLSFEEIDSGNLSLDSDVVISENASGMGGSQVFLESGDSYKVSELIKSITVASANDASYALAEKICGSEELFVDKMNLKAKELGMENTHFTNCTGLPKVGQYSCAKDVAKMFSELIRHKDYFTFSRIWMDEIKHSNDRITQISNTNKLIRFYDGCDGGKTGYTGEAGHCLCATSKRGDTRLISVVICAPDSKTRFSEVSSMFNYGFANFVNKLIVDDNKPLDLKVEIDGGKQDFIKVKAEEPIFLFSKKDKKRNVEINFLPNERVKAPIKCGDVVGKLSIFENGTEIRSVNVLSLESVEKMTYFDYIKSIGENWGLI